MGEKIKPILWNKELGRCIESNSNTQEQNRYAKRVNKYIDHIEGEVSKILFMTYKHDNPSYWDISRIKDGVKKVIRNYKEKAIEEKIQKELTPSMYFEKYIDSLAKRVIKRTGIYMSPSTIEHHKIILKRYKKFIQDNRLLIDTFDIFNNKFESAFETWCYIKKITLPIQLPLHFL